VLNDEIEINAPVSVVWGVFSATEDWENWTEVCQNCCMQEGSGLARESRLSFALRPYFFPITVSPQIIEYEPDRKIVLEGSRLGIHVIHSYTFTEKQNSVILTSRMQLRGPLSVLSRLIFIPGKLRRLTREFLREIKKEAEKRSNA
jgi:ligand-binding SRPBCC domain-containing protein